jgi:hypothetical protein
MKSTILLFAAACFAASLHAEQPLHSCELYTGGCVASSEVTMQGKVSVTAWNFEAGTSAGTPLKGLQVALLQVSDRNLASESAPSKAVVYLPEQATASERAALLSWVQKEAPQAEIKAVRSAPIAFAGEGVNLTFQAGEWVSLQSGPLLPCGMGSCGESLWYSPRVSADIFTVAMSEQSQVVEKELQLTWRQAGTRNVFVGNFDHAKRAPAQFTSCESLCMVE